MDSVPEKDWKTLRTLRESLLNSSCDAIFRRVEQISSTRQGREHEAFLTLWTKILDENKAIAAMFDDLKRSNMIIKLATMKHYGVLTDEHLAQFSPETQEQVMFFYELKR